MKIFRAYSSISHIKQIPKESCTVLNGNLIKKDEERSFKVLSPIDGKLIKHVPILTKTEVLQAVEKCDSAQIKWSNESATTRSKVIRKISELLTCQKEDFAQIIHIENGKNISDALGELNSAISGLEWYSEEAKRSYGHNITPVNLVDNFMVTQHKAIGTVAMITPWNFPLSMITRKAGAALAAGCGVLIKPSFLTPLSAIAWANICVEANLPPELISIVTCSKKEDSIIGDIFTQHPKIKMIGFTGSSGVGKMLYEKSGSRCKHVNLELGGNAPFIIFESSNLDDALKGLLASKFRCSGQTCISPNRLFVHTSIKERFIQMLAGEVSKMKISPGSNEGLAPLISPQAVERVEKMVNDSVQMGAKPIIENSDINLGDYTGFFYPANILTNCTENMPIVKEEIFGPIIPVLEFTNEKEVIEKANNTEAGLAGYFYSKNIQQIFRVARQLEVGMIGVNTGFISTAEAPFGGVKHSGIGREGGPDCLKEFMTTK